MARMSDCPRCLALHFLGEGRMCHDCQSLKTDPGEVQHEKRIRCPKCGHDWEPDFETPIWQEDGGEAWCAECDTSFHVGTSITYTFTSPPLVKVSR